MSRRTPPEIRFFSKVTWAYDGCWLYTGARMKNGYGSFYVGPRNAVSPVRLAHRWSYEFHVGPIPEGHEVHHLCGTRHCVNPAHLTSMPRKDHNLQPGHCGFLNATKTHCPRGHEYSGMKGKSRHCRACNTLAKRAAHQAKHPDAPRRPWRYKYEVAA